MKRRVTTLSRLVIVRLMTVAGLLSLTLVAVPSAHAEQMDSCPHLATIQSLQVCLEQMTAQGIIDSQGIAQSLLAKADAAQAAVDRGQPAVAVNVLEAFVAEVSAQAGKHIAQPHANHLIMHAELVIQALESSGTA
jgi:hypothetical protein